ncbi:hypothetical protein ACIQ6V_18170 [Streptomyces sp. NPDC096198]|uniref:hypothetical protein n=1 Tax=Streptomyces sp. NPDC096198 TaxID=3366080 RepID=UPI00380C42FB
MHETVRALRTIREQWAALLLAIETPPVDHWPPRQLAHIMREGDDELLVEDRAPLVLREHPAPLNLAALDAGRAVERLVFDLADTLAAAVQHSTSGDPRAWVYADPGAPDSHRAAGSRRHGLHFACVWVEGRVLDEDTAAEREPDGTVSAPPFEVLPPHLLHEVRRTARIAEARVLRALGLDRRETPLPEPCPWCAGELILYGDPEQAPTATCSTGPECTAPVPLDERSRRVWRWADLLTLVAALSATHQNSAVE